MTIELEQEIEAQLIERAQQAGQAPEAYAVELLRAMLSNDKTGNGEHTDDAGWLRDANETPLGFDGMTWRQIAHLDHKY